MSTRSVIAIQRGDDKYECIYCHSDGYLTYNGAMLLDNYSDKEKLEKLIKLGDISCLNEKVEPDPSKPHSFDYSNRQEDVTVAYGRDRGDTDVQSKMLNLEKMKEWGWIEYIYIFDKNNEWQYSKYPFDEFETVKKGLDKEYKKLKIKRPKDFYGFWTDESLAKERKKQQNSEGEM